jgi:hypothetical protein
MEKEALSSLSVLWRPENGHLIPVLRFKFPPYEKNAEWPCKGPSVSMVPPPHTHTQNFKFASDKNIGSWKRPSFLTVPFPAL